MPDYKVPNAHDHMRGPVPVDSLGIMLSQNHDRCPACGSYTQLPNSDLLLPYASSRSQAAIKICGQCGGRYRFAPVFNRQQSIPWVLVGVMAAMAMACAVLLML